MIEKLYGISADKYSSAAVYVGGVSTAEEIACFDAVDESAASDILAACEKRIEDLKTQVESYNPDELPKLNTPVLLTKGNSVYMCLSNDNDKAEEIIG
ncbi:conserved domain protein [Ruminococcus sp. CAG:579]|jgi:predicted DNA-binding helix-hairpin-helix protein|nr:conserved domain protein [Ruminococcus sp. CAG:579]